MGTRDTERAQARSHSGTVVDYEVVESTVGLIRVRGPLDAPAGRLVDRIVAGLVQRGHAQLVLELSAVSWIDSTGAAACVVAAGRTAELGGAVVLCGAPRPVAQSLDTLGVSVICHTAARLAEALALLAGPAPRAGHRPDDGGP